MIFILTCSYIALNMYDEGNTLFKTNWTSNGSYFDVIGWGGVWLWGWGMLWVFEKL